VGVTDAAATTAKRAARPLVRAGGERAAETILRRLERSGLRAGVAIAYHSVAGRTGDPRYELVPPHSLELFEAALEHLTRRYRVVPSADLVSATAGRSRGEPFPAAVTFDDDLESHVTHALPVLRRLKITATFFLTGRTLERPYTFWWDRLQDAVDVGVEVPPPEGGEAAAVPRRGIHSLGRTVEDLSPGRRDRWADELPPGATARGLPHESVRTLIAGGMTVGFHTYRHDALTTLDDEHLARAMEAGRGELEAVVGRRLSEIGYPHGRADARVAAAARAGGFDIGFTTAEVAVTPADDLLLLGRINPSYRSLGHFALQLARALASAHR
jgi:peptidoglycan/xylan/chitin deacetylase (PgdA/CDA1 family)